MSDLLKKGRQRLAAESSGASSSRAVDDGSSLSSWSWKSSFVDGELGVTLGRAIRKLGEVVIRPVDDGEARTELHRVNKQLCNLGNESRETRKLLDDNALRLVEVLRPVYPPDIITFGQYVIFRLTFYNNVTFSNVRPDIRFADKPEFIDSMESFAKFAHTLLPRQLLLSRLRLHKHPSEFIAELRYQLSLLSDTPSDTSLSSLTSSEMNEFRLYKEGKDKVDMTLTTITSPSPSHIPISLILRGGRGSEYIKPLRISPTMSSTMSSSDLTKLSSFIGRSYKNFRLRSHAGRQYNDACLVKVTAGLLLSGDAEIQRLIAAALHSYVNDASGKRAAQTFMEQVISCTDSATYARLTAVLFLIHNPDPSS